MKKIIVAFDGLKYSKTAAEYAIDMAAQMKAHLVGVFLDDFSYHSYKIYELVQQEGGVSEERIERFENKDQDSRERAAELFELACRDAGFLVSQRTQRFSQRAQRLSLNLAKQGLFAPSAVHCVLCVTFSGMP